MKRIKRIVDFINDNDVVADVGCDHGYLLKIAIEDKNIKKCYAIDNKVGPLNSAKSNLSNFGNVVYCLSDGLLNVDGDYNCVVIAGMGGMLINKIFLDSIEKFKNINKIIVCPNKNIDKVRECFTFNDYKISDETIVEEDNLFYEIIVFEKGNQKLSNIELKFGPINLLKKDEMFHEKWKNYLERIKDIEYKQEEVCLIKEVLNYENK